MREFDWRVAAGNAFAAGALAIIAAGVVDIPAFLAAFTPHGEPTGSAFVIAEQLRWGAGVAAVALLLRAAGLFGTRPIRALRSLLNRGSTAHWTLVIFGLAVGARLLYAAGAVPPPISDEQHYLRLAHNLAAGSGYTSGAAPTAYWPVGYPAFLAAFFIPGGGHYFSVVMCQSFLGAATAVAVAFVARDFVAEGGARAAGLIIALCPGQVAYASRLFPAVVLAFAITLTAAIYLKTRGYRGAVGAGVLNGLAALVAPVALVLPAAAVASDLFRRIGLKRTLTRGAIFAVMTVAAVAPWTVRNGRVFGEFIPISTNGGVNLWIGNNPNATGAYRYPTSRINPLFMTEGEQKRDRLGREFAWYFIKNERSRFLTLAVPKLVYTYGADVSAFQLEANASASAVSALEIMALIGQGYYALIWVGFVVGLLKIRRGGKGEGPGGRAALGALFAWPVALTSVYLIFFGAGRFHFPMLPFIAILAGAAVCGHEIGRLRVVGSPSETCPEDTPV